MHTRSNELNCWTDRTKMFSPTWILWNHPGMCSPNQTHLFQQKTYVYLISNSSRLSAQKRIISGLYWQLRGIQPRLTAGRLKGVRALPAPLAPLAPLLFGFRFPRHLRGK